MQLNELVEYVKNDLTAGGMIKLNVNDDVIYSYVTDGIERVRPWFMESPEFQTVTPVFTESESHSGYIEISVLEKTVHIIDYILPLKVRHAGDFVLEEISDLLGLPAGLFSSASIREYATWVKVREEIKQSMSKKLAWRVIGERIYFDDAPSGQSGMTVVYIPLPESLEEIEFVPAITWIKDWTLAKTKIAWSGVLSKFSGGSIGYSTNASELRSEGMTSLTALEEKLKTLQFQYVYAGR